MQKHKVNIKEQHTRSKDKRIKKLKRVYNRDGGKEVTSILTGTPYYADQGIQYNKGPKVPFFEDEKSSNDFEHTPALEPKLPLMQSIIIV